MRLEDRVNMQFLAWEYRIKRERGETVMRPSNNVKDALKAARRKYRCKI